MTEHREPESDGRPGRLPWSPPRKLRGAAGKFRARFAPRRSRPGAAGNERELFKAGTPPDVPNVRAKSSRHGKSTADKWNQ